MDVEGYPILGVIEGDEVASNLILPVYQRRYTWTEENCKTLFKDIVYAAMKSRPHFLGSFVRVDGGVSNKVRKYLVIDGQQRVTSICLLLKAIMDHESCENELKNEIKDSLFNKKNKKKGYEPSIDNKIRLILTSEDDVHYKKLLNDDIEHIPDDSLIKINYLNFGEWLDAAIKSGRELTCKTIYEGICQQQVACITIVDGSDDSPQEVFESLNTTGVELSFADKAKNFLFMGDFNQDKDYEKWLDIENNISIENLDKFILHYLRYSTGRRITEGNAYTEFKNLLKYSFNNMSLDMLLDMRKCSEYYTVFLYGSNDYSSTVNCRLDELRDLHQTTVYPFLLHLFDDFKRNILDKEYFEKILNLLVVYIIRRNICNVKTGSLNGLFTSMYNRVFADLPLKKETITPKKYYEAILAFFASLGNTNDKIPEDADIRNSIVSTADYYSNANEKRLAKIMLEYIENATEDGQESPEKMDLTNFQVEHIMPQKPAKDWQEFMGDDPDDTFKLLNTFGNLSLTAQNQAMSNLPFDVKQGMIICNSKLTRLNKDVLKASKWTRQVIEERADNLIEVLLQRLKIEIPANLIVSPRKNPKPRVENPIDNSGEPSEHGGDKPGTWVPLAKGLNFTGTCIDQYSYNGDLYSANSYKAVLSGVADMLYSKDSALFGNIADGGYRASKYVKRSNDDMHQSYKEFGDAKIFLNTHGNSNMLMRKLYCLLRDYKIDVSTLQFHVISGIVKDESSTSSSSNTEEEGKEKSQDTNSANDQTSKEQASDVATTEESAIKESGSEEPANDVSSEETGSDDTSGADSTPEVQLSYNVNDDNIYRIIRKRKGEKIEAYGRYDPDKNQMAVLEGSQIDLSTNGEGVNVNVVEGRNKAFQNGDIKQIGDKYILIKATHPQAPSSAAGFVLGTSVSGYEAWTDKNGNKLGSILKHKDVT